MLVMRRDFVGGTLTAGLFGSFPSWGLQQSDAEMDVMRDAGFKGVYSLEFEGMGAPLDGTRKLMRMTEQHLV